MNRWRGGCLRFDFGNAGMFVLSEIFKMPMNWIRVRPFAHGFLSGHHGFPSVFDAKSRIEVENENFLLERM